MHVLNFHEREFQVSARQVGELINSLTSPGYLLWPKETWPPLKFDTLLLVGATRGHDPIFHRVENCYRGSYVRFDGYHEFRIVEISPTKTVLRHTLETNTHGLAIISWPFVFRPLHDALIEDALAKAEASLCQKATVEPWSPWVWASRWIFSGGRARPQFAQGNSYGYH